MEAHQAKLYIVASERQTERVKKLRSEWLQWLSSIDGLIVNVQL